MRTDEAAARRYARGMAECAAGNGTLARAVADARRAADLLDANSPVYSADLASAMASPSATAEAKTAALTGVLSSLGIAEEVRSAFALLVRRGRTGLAPRIADCMEEIAASGESTASDSSGAAEVTAVVHTARALSAGQEASLAAALAGKFGRPVRLRQRVDPALLAGARVTVGEWSLDGTVAGQLEALRRRLVATGRTAITEAAQASQPVNTVENAQ